MDDATDFAGVFRNWQTEHPAKPALVFLRESGTELLEEVVTYHELDRQARGVASWLFANTAFGDRVVLLFRPGPSFVGAFLGCLYAGVIAVPAPLPSFGDGGFARLRGLTLDADAQVVLTESGLMPKLEELIDDEVLPTGIRYTSTDTLPESRHDWEQPGVLSGTVAFLQYTSGSTNAPKGVMVTHGNLTDNQRRIQRALRTDSDTSIAGWLPHYHDMGLIGQLLHGLYVGGTVHFMSPMAFLKLPCRWLSVISEYRCTVSAATNFAFDLVVNRVTDDEVAKLDLSSMKALCNGSEPVHHTTLQAFVRRFRTAGLRETAVIPCYGLAESTLFVAGTGFRQPATRVIDGTAIEKNMFRPTSTADRKVLVSSGIADTGMLRIVDPETHELLPDGRAGEIWLRGDSVAAGYWNRPVLSQRTFNAKATDGEGGFLRTGDIGVIDEGELYVIGRIKEVLIVNGRHIYPADIEQYARQAHPALRLSKAAAFAAGSDHQQPVLVQEISTKRLGGTSMNELVQLIRRKVSTELDVHLSRVVPVVSGSVAVTTSGKVQRNLMREKFMSGQLRTHPLAGAPVALGSGQGGR